MLNDTCFDSGHLSDYAIDLIVSGGTYNADMYILLDHLESCSECMDKYIHSVTAGGLEEPPAVLNERIMEKIKSEKPGQGGVQVVFINILKMGVGVSLALLLFFSGAFQKISSGAASLIDLIGERREPSQSYQPPKKTLNTFFANIDSGFSDFAAQLNSLFKGDVKHEQ
jgi:hypothetical protein